MPRVLITEPIADAGVQILEDAGVEVDVRPGLEPGELVSAIAGYDGLIIRSATKVTADVIDSASSLKVIGRAGVGVDNVDVDAATRRGVLVVNAPQGNIISNAEHAIALLLAVARRIPQAHASLTSGRWEKDKFFGAELHEKVLGVLGLGRVGTLVAQRCNAFGMKLIACDPYKTAQAAARLGVELVDLNELLSRSDVIALCVTKTPETTHIVGEAELERCKPGVLIVNCSRGGVIDEEALASAIKAGRVAGAGLDVFETEPTTWSPLFDLPEVVVTPHIGGQTNEAQDKAGILIAEQVLQALRGEFVHNAVNVSAEMPESVKEFVPLAEKLGKLASALSKAAPGALEVEYRGRVAEEDTRILTLATLRSYLQPAVLQPVTYVNASVIATERGLETVERKSTAESGYTSLVRVQAGGVTVAGTLLGPRNEQRLVEIDGVPIEITFTPFMAFFRYEDRPGVIHRLTGPLSEQGINIATMQVGRNEQGGESILALSVDSEIPPGVFEQAMRAAGIPHGKFVVLS